MALLQQLPPLQRDTLSVRMTRVSFGELCAEKIVLFMVVVVECTYQCFAHINASSSLIVSLALEFCAPFFTP